MQKVDFISMVGAEVKINANLLAKEYVEKVAEKHFNQEVVCTPCLFGTGALAVGWEIKSKQTTVIIGYLTLVTGSICDYPDDFEYGVTTIIPLGTEWAFVFNFRLRYCNEMIELAHK